MNLKAVDIINIYNMYGWLLSSHNYPLCLSFWSTSKASIYASILTQLKYVMFGKNQEILCTLLLIPSTKEDVLVSVVSRIKLKQQNGLMTHGNRKKLLKIGKDPFRIFFLLISCGIMQRS